MQDERQCRSWEVNNGLWADMVCGPGGGGEGQGVWGWGKGRVVGEEGGAWK